MSLESRALYRQIPAIGTLLRDVQFIPLVKHYGTQQVTHTLRLLQRQARDSIRQSQKIPVWCHDWVDAVTQQLVLSQKNALLPLYNLTGTILHTNLGRALLAENAVTATLQAMRHPVTLEYDLKDAGRGHRDQMIASRLCQLTGAEDACIVNNNAAAVLLMLAALAPAQQVIISRGELVEIGGAFRIPDVMRQAGVLLTEVGTTNRTHLSDYQNAITPQTALLMKVHTSNYQIQGFSCAVTPGELVALGHKTGLPVIADLGSGSLIDMKAYGLPEEPMPQKLIAEGVDLVSFSGDKLLGGPQAGIIVGKRHLIQQLQRHPLKRALRCSKIILAALDSTLQLYQYPEKLPKTLPTLNYLTRTTCSIRLCAERLLPPLQQHYAQDFLLAISPCQSKIGSGSLPVDHLSSYAITFTPHSGHSNALTRLTAQWRTLSSPVIGRLAEGKLWLDLRCLDDEQGLLRVLCQ